MAVGIIIGAAFGSIVTSLVADVIMPPISLLMGKVDFLNLFWTLREGDVAGLYTASQKFRTRQPVARIAHHNWRHPCVEAFTLVR